MTILPRTTVGKWSLGLFIVSLIVPRLTDMMMSNLDRIGGRPFDLMMIAWILLFTSGILAIVSWVKKDEAVLLVLPIIQSAFWILFIVGEILVPH